MSDRVAERVCRTWAFIALAAAALSAPASAELQTVGLDAQGVDVRASLKGDLDVRDIFNRPVSRALVERQLALARAAADPSPLLSRLPLIQAVWEALNRVLLGVGLRGGRPGAGLPSADGSPWRLPRPDLRVLVALVILASAVAQSLRLRPAAVRPEPSSSRPRVLRC